MPLKICDFAAKQNFMLVDKGEIFVPFRRPVARNDSKSLRRACTSAVGADQQQSNTAAAMSTARTHATAICGNQQRKIMGVKHDMLTRRHDTAPITR